MLEDITIKDYALIESTYLEFHNGFTVLSGETGAGKSIIIGAMSFLLGGKADVSVIRTGKTEASVTATFYLGFNTNPKNGRVKALSKACLDRTYSRTSLRDFRKKIVAIQCMYILYYV